MSVLENTLTVFFTTLAVGYATRILSKKKDKEKLPRADESIGGVLQRNNNS